MEKPTQADKMTLVKTIRELTVGKYDQSCLAFFHPLSRRMHVIMILMIGCFCMAYTRSNLGMVMTCLINSSTVTPHNDKDSNLGILELKREALRCACPTRQL